MNGPDVVEAIRIYTFGIALLLFAVLIEEAISLLLLVLIEKRLRNPQWRLTVTDRDREKEPK